MGPRRSGNPLFGGHMPGAVRLALFLLSFLAWGASGVPAHASDLGDLDVDGNGQVDALTDGLLLVRYLFGFQGTTLTDGAVGIGAVRTTGAEIVAFLELTDCLAMEDVDANGEIDALSDGILVIRWQFGFTGDTLTDGALGEGSVANDESINDHLAYYASDRAETLPEQALQPGEELQSSSGLVKLRNPEDVAVTVRVIEGVDADGVPEIEVRADGTVEMSLPDPDSSEATGDITLQQGLREAPQAPAEGASDYPITNQWDGGNAWYTKGLGDPAWNRLPGSNTDQPVRTDEKFKIPKPEEGFWLLWARSMRAWALESACAHTDTDCYQQKEPVLFIHGYQKWAAPLQGGRDYWLHFPRLVGEADGNAYVPFEFRWSSATRFQDAAQNLRDAIITIARVTGRKVHLVAHSFGGLLVRTLLQGWGVEGISDGLIASLTTLGTPHSGIFDADTCRGSSPFPDGQDAFNNIDWIKFCKHLSCYQAGENISLGFSNWSQLFLVEDTPGELIAGLDAQALYPLPDIPIQVLIGLTTGRYPSGVIDDGDALITYEGQRFRPVDSVEVSTPNTCDENDLNPLDPDLRSSIVVGQAWVTEHLLAFPDTTRPGHPNPVPGNGGYKHNRSADAGYPPPPQEAYVECETEVGCSHEGLSSVLDWIREHPAGEAVILDADGLVAWYQFENNLDDAKGNNDGVVQPSNGTISYGVGKVGAAAVFDRNADHFMRVQSDQLDFLDRGDEDWTITLWLKVTEVASGGIWDKHKGYGSGFESLFNNAGVLSFWWEDYGTPGTFKGGVDIPIPDNQWLAVAYVMRSGTLELHINGDGVALKGSSATNPAADWIDPLPYLDIGGSRGRAFSGLLDEVRIWNRALSETEIQQLAGISGTDPQCEHPEWIQKHEGRP